MLEANARGFRNTQFCTLLGALPEECPQLVSLRAASTPREGGKAPLPQKAGINRVLCLQHRWGADSFVEYLIGSAARGPIVERNRARARQAASTRSDVVLKGDASGFGEANRGALLGSVRVTHTSIVRAQLVATAATAQRGMRGEAREC